MTMQQQSIVRRPAGARGLWNLRERNFRGRGFTLTELLVAIGIMALLSTLTVVSVKSLSNEARLSSGRNAVSAALGAARAFAMKNNQIVLVAFRPRLIDNGQSQVVDAVFAGWTGESVNVGDDDDPDVVDRFVFLDDLSARSLPKGIKVAGPYYRDPENPITDGMTCDVSSDVLWVTQTHFPAGTAEAYGELIGVMYAPDGTTITRNSLSDSNYLWIDFNGDGVPQVTGLGAVAAAWENDFPATENPINIVPFLAVFDDDDLRRTIGTTGWDDFCTKVTAVSDYVSQYADRIHFNRYTGVIMK